MRRISGPTLPSRGDGWIIVAGLAILAAVVQALATVLP